MEQETNLETGNNGWIKIHRKILNNPIATKPTYLALWVHLLLLANHNEGKQFIWNSEIVKQEAGQFITGRKNLSAQSGIPESTIEDILKLFEKLELIRQQKTTKYRCITILKWNLYQKSDNKATTKQQQSDTIKNYNNYKNTNIYTPDFEEFWNSYPKKIAKSKAYQEWKKLSEADYIKIKEDIPKRKLDKKWIEGFVKDPERYLKYRQWEDDIIKAKQDSLKIESGKYNNIKKITINQ